MKRYYLFIITFLTWVLAYVLTVTQIKTIGVINQSTPNFYGIIAFGFIVNMVIFYGVSLYIIPKYFHYDKLSQSIGSLLGFYLILTLIECLFDHAFVESATKDLEFLSEVIIVNFSINFVCLITGSAVGFTYKWLKNERQKQALAQENLKSQIDFLKTQVNPHFLFNVLNMAYASSVKSNDHRTSEIIMELSDMMRYMLYETDEKLVPIDKEIEYMESYISLQKKRISEETLISIHFKNHVLPDQKFKIAPMLLIPFIENAFKHGIKSDQETYIDITLQVDSDKTLELTVKNKINSKSEIIKEVGGIGLNNVKKRLELLYPQKYTLDIVSDDAIYFVNLKLNLE